MGTQYYRNQRWTEAVYCSRWRNGPDITEFSKVQYGRLLSVSPPEEHHEKLTFTDVAAIQVRVTAVLQSIPKDAFANSFQKLYKRCQKCVVKDDDYFEGQ
jgi:hypothetical protein